MRIKNNKPKTQWLRYKVKGKMFKKQFKAFEVVEIKEITNSSQIVYNTYQRRVKNINREFGNNFDTDFSIV